MFLKATRPERTCFMCHERQLKTLQRVAIAVCMSKEKHELYRSYEISILDTALVLRNQFNPDAWQPKSDDPKHHFIHTIGMDIRYSEALHFWLKRWLRCKLLCRGCRRSAGEIQTSPSIEYQGDG
jgi:hypothetical protein